jgi:hypothetical protein
MHSCHLVVTGVFKAGRVSDNYHSVTSDNVPQGNGACGTLAGTLCIVTHQLPLVVEPTTTEHQHGPITVTAGSMKPPPCSICCLYWECLPQRCPARTFPLCVPVQRDTRRHNLIKAAQFPAHCIVFTPKDTKTERNQLFSVTPKTSTFKILTESRDRTVHLRRTACVSSPIAPIST